MSAAAAATDQATATAGEEPLPHWMEELLVSMNVGRTKVRI